MKTVFIRKNRKAVLLRFHQNIILLQDLDDQIYDKFINTCLAIVGLAHKLISKQFLRSEIDFE